MTTPEPRLAPLPESRWTDEVRPLFDAMGPLNIFTTLAHHPKLLKRWMVFGGHVLAKSTLPGRPREIAILRVGWRCDCAYEFGQHTLIGAAEGLTEDEIARLATDDAGEWEASEQAVIAAADELVASHRLSDATWAALTAHFSTEQVLDLIFAVGQYTLVSMALNALQVQREDGVPGFPA